MDFQEGARRSARGRRSSGLVDDLVGVQAVMDRGALDRIAGDGSLVSGAYLADRPGVGAGELNRRLLRMPRVAGVALAGGHPRSSVERMLEDSLLWFTGLLTFFAVLIAVGVVYNGARLALAERERELATLRVIGFTRGEVVADRRRRAVRCRSWPACPLGWLAGWGFVELTAAATASELMRLPAAGHPGQRRARHGGGGGRRGGRGPLVEALAGPARPGLGPQGEGVSHEGANHPHRRCGSPGARGGRLGPLAGTARRGGGAGRRAARCG